MTLEKGYPFAVQPSLEIVHSNFFFLFNLQGILVLDIELDLELKWKQFFQALLPVNKEVYKVYTTSPYPNIYSHTLTFTHSIYHTHT